MTLEQALLTEESSTFDRKSFRIEPKALAQILVAMANSDGGEVVVGLSDTNRTNRMCRELETAECGDVRYVLQGFILQSTVYNKNGFKDYSRNNPIAEKLAIGNISIANNIGDSAVENTPIAKNIGDSKGQKLAFGEETGDSKGQKLAFGEETGDSNTLADFSNTEQRLKLMEAKAKNYGCTHAQIKNLSQLITSIAGNEVFGAKEIRSILDCSISSSKNYLKLFRNIGMVTPVKGIGKGRYVFVTLDGK